MLFAIDFDGIFLHVCELSISRDGVSFGLGGCFCRSCSCHDDFVVLEKFGTKVNGGY